MSRRKNRHIPYQRLHGVDIVGFNKRGIFSTIARCVTGRNRIRDIFNRNVWTHIGIVVELRGQMLVAEMIGTGKRKGLQLNSMERYRKSIHSFGRFAALDNYDIREEIQNTIMRMHRLTVDYDHRGLGEFVSRKITDNPRKLYCSELVYELLKKHVFFPRTFAVRVSPEELHHCSGITNIGR